jgi:hypothetical protein
LNEASFLYLEALGPLSSEHFRVGVNLSPSREVQDWRERALPQISQVITAQDVKVHVMENQVLGETVFGEDVSVLLR